MALIRANTSGGGGGAAKVPFTLTPSSGRCTFASQDCYVYMDGDTPKMHVEFVATMTTSVSANASFITHMLPFKQSDIVVKNVLPNNLYVLSTNNAIVICSTSAISSGYTYNVNVDITLEW